jgi:hypothetical protein
VHAGWCRTCNEGKGYQQRIRNRRTPDQPPFGQWHGPYPDSLEATVAAHRILAGSARLLRPCGLCLGRNSASSHRHTIAPNRPLNVTFRVHINQGGSVTMHASTCPNVMTRQIADSPIEEIEGVVADGGGDWYGPYNRLASARLKADELIERASRGRLRHCMMCGRNSRLSRLDDLLAGPLALDAPAATAAIAASASQSAKQVVCLECGKARKILGRHLRQVHKITPEQYRQKWNLPTDYPMIPAGHLKRMRTARRHALVRQDGHQDQPFPNLLETD